MCTVTAEARDVILTTSDQYTLYSGDLDVSVSIPDTLNISSASLELVSSPDDRRVTTYQLHAGFVGVISVTCGAVDSAGQFVFQLVDHQGSRSHVVARTSPINVSWPSSAVTLILPDSHRALTSRLHLTVDVASLQCDSVHQGVYYTLQLLYLGRDESDGFQTQQVVDTKKFPTLISLGAQQMTYACRLIDQAGVYEAVIKSSHDGRHVVARSNRLTVSWSDAYKLRANVDTVLPCSGQLVVEFTQPSCSLRDDKLRLYAQRDRHSTSSQLQYVTERRVINDESTVSFECRLFKPTDFAYCFKYISTANNGAVNEQTTLCLPTSNSTGQLCFFVQKLSFNQSHCIGMVHWQNQTFETRVPHRNERCSSCSFCCYQICKKIPKALSIHNRS